jgi:hypothetical protein
MPLIYSPLATFGQAAGEVASTLSGKQMARYKAHDFTFTMEFIDRRNDINKYIGSSKLDTGPNSFTELQYLLRGQTSLSLTIKLSPSKIKLCRPDPVTVVRPRSFMKANLSDR